MERINGKLVKIFIEGNEKVKRELLYKSIIEKLEGLDISGATVLRGIEGFGNSKEIHTDILEVAARKLPIVIEVLVLDEGKLNKLIKEVPSMIGKGKIAITDNVTILDIK